MCIESSSSPLDKSHHFARLAGVALAAESVRVAASKTIHILTAPSSRLSEPSPACCPCHSRLSDWLLAPLSCRVPVSELPPRMADYPSSGGTHLIPQFQPLRRVVLMTHQRSCLVFVSGGLPDRTHNHRLHRTHKAATGKPQAVISLPPIHIWNLFKFFF